MLKSLIILQLILQSFAANFNATQFCSLVKNGTQLKDPDACNTYIDCQQLQPISHVCSENLFFNLQTATCEPAENVKCVSSNPCAVLTSETGFVPDPLSCNHYYYCSQNVPTLGSCQNNGNYNATSQTCVVNSTCSITLYPDDYCNIIPNGVFIKDPTNCSNYQFCSQNQLINGTCPESYYFDAFAGICTQNITKACDLPIPTTTLPTLNASAVCSENGQFVSDEQTCNGYYYCEENANNNFTLIHGNCPAGRFFSGAKNGVCVPRTSIVCPYDRCAGFGLKSIQLANLSDDNCKGYAICQNGEEIGKGVCPNNEYFDEEEQICTTNVITYKACITTTTTTTMENETETSTIIETP